MSQDKNEAYGKTVQALLGLIMTRARETFSETPVVLSSTSDEWAYKAQGVVDCCEAMIPHLTDDMLEQALETLRKIAALPVHRSLQSYLEIKIPELEQRIGDLQDGGDGSD